MKKNFKQMQQHTEVMETETIQKKTAKPYQNWISVKF
jgi:hypothetical protein